VEENNELNLSAIKATPKIGNEHLTFNEKSVGYSLLEFWQWSVSDILSNATVKTLKTEKMNSTQKSMQYF